ncbi:MAG: fumarate hydratase [Kiritimatiellae bacterium]|nr:fumarate hydratase [Kiritimatiellia bacterium]
MTTTATAERLVRLIRDTSSKIPDDVLRAIAAARRRERRGSSAAAVLGTVLENCALAQEKGVPLCQDTGTLTFFVDRALRGRVTPASLRRAVARATALGYLRRNCIDPVDGRSYDDNCAEGAPVVHYVDAGEVPGLPPRGVALIMKGGGSENMSRQYSLPDAGLGAGRDLAGVKACILDAVKRALGYGCAPGILGVAVGGDRATGFETAKAQLLRPLDEKPRAGDARERALVRLEREVLREANALGIGPMGLGGATTLLGVKIAARPRVPASFFVTVAYMCWACRRRIISL